MKIAVGVVTHNGEDLIDECLDSVLGQIHLPEEIAIIDNASQDNTTAKIVAFEARAKALEHPLWIVVNTRNSGFTAGADQILRRYTEGDGAADIVVLLNQDAYLDRNCLQVFSEAFAASETLAVAGPKILYPDLDTIQYAGGEIERPRGIGYHIGHHETDEGQFDEPTDTGFVTGAVMALRVEALTDVGVFDEVFSPGYYEDVELCDRIRDGGWAVRYIPRARAWHHESSSFSDRGFRLRLAQRNRLLYLIPRLQNPGFERQLRDAELEAIATLLVPDELRALAAACLELRSRLKFFVAARSPSADEDDLARIAALLTDIRHAAFDRLIGRSSQPDDR